MFRFVIVAALFGVGLSLLTAADEKSVTEVAKSAHALKTTDPLPLYHADPKHLWNRLFAALYIRKSRLPEKPGGKPVEKIEGGDIIDFLAWPRTTYWSNPETSARLNRLFDEFLKQKDSDQISDPLKRTILLRDLWAVYDFLIEQNMKRFGSLETRKRREVMCRKLAKMMSSLALTRKEISKLPDNYAAAIRSGYFDQKHEFKSRRNYLPAGLLTQPNEWVEVDFFQPNLHEDLSNRFVTLHTRQFRGRSYFRIFYRFPGGRKQLAAYLKHLGKVGVDWKQAAQNGFIFLKKDTPQIPVGTEVALVQFMMTLDNQLRPTPTRIVESIRLRTFASVDGSEKIETNTGLGMNVIEYTLKRGLLFDGVKRGGLYREPEELPQPRVIFQPRTARDWGTVRNKVLFQQCIDCHTTPKGTRTGVHSMPSIVNMGGFNAGAQLGIVFPLDPKLSDTRGLRAAKFKAGEETYRRLLDHLGR